MKFLYDIECFPDFFFVGFKNYETKKLITFEISEDIDQKEELYQFLKQLDKNNTFFISFNGIDYDNIIINYFYKNYKEISGVTGFKNWDFKSITNALKEFSNYVINNKDNYDDIEIKKYKYHNKWIDIDLFRYWSRMIRINKKISLKSLGIQLNHTRVQELPYQHDKILNKEEREKVKDYNLNNDLIILEKLCDKMKSQIIQRQDANIKYGFDCWSWDGVKLGLNILLEEYCKEFKYKREQINSLRSRLEPIKIERLLSHKIIFKETEQKVELKYDKQNKPYYLCNSFYSLYNHLKERIVSTTNELSYSVILHGVKYDIKSGGLHSYHNSEIVEPDLSKFIYKDADVSSMYPTLGAIYSYTPSHLPGMDKVILRIRNQRLEYKKNGDKKNAELYKLALNGGYYGNLNSEYTPMYDPKMLLSVTLNGQMYLLMLCEMLINEGIQIDSVNTDGVTSIIPKELEDKYYQVCKKWEELTLMELEYDDYKKIIRGNINNYLGIKVNDEIKEKGIWFLTNPDLGNSVDALIIAKSLKLYYTKGIPIEDSISNPEKYGFTIFDYCYSNKISKDYTVWWNNKMQQNLNRYYIGNKNSPYLYKKKKSKTTMENVLKGFGVELFNDYVEKPFKDYKVNTQYYISKVREILFELEPNQINLF